MARRNPRGDEELRRLERLAATGDVAACAGLMAAEARADAVVGGAYRSLTMLVEKMGMPAKQVAEFLAAVSDGSMMSSEEMPAFMPGPVTRTDWNGGPVCNALSVHGGMTASAIPEWGKWAGAILMSFDFHEGAGGPLLEGRAPGSWSMIRAGQRPYGHGWSFALPAQIVSRWCELVLCVPDIYCTPESNPPRGDERLRELERAAAQGDPQAQAQLEAERARRGVAVTARDLAQLIPTVDGRYPSWAQPVGYGSAAEYPYGDPPLGDETGMFFVFQDRRGVDQMRHLIAQRYPLAAFLEGGTGRGNNNLVLWVWPVQGCANQERDANGQWQARCGGFYGEPRAVGLDPWSGTALCAGHLQQHLDSWAAHGRRQNPLQPGSQGRPNRGFAEWVTCPTHGPVEPRVYTTADGTPVRDYYGGLAVIHPALWTSLTSSYDDGRQHRLAYCSVCGAEGPLKRVDVPRGNRTKSGKPLERCGGKCLGGNPNGSCECLCRGRCHGAGRCSCGEGRVKNPGDEERRRLERLAKQGDREAQAKLEATRGRIGKDPPWVRWSGCATAALTGVNDQPELWRAVRATSPDSVSPIVTASQRMDARTLLRQAQVDGADVVFLQQPHDWAPGPYVLAFYDGAVWAALCGVDAFTTWRDGWESDGARSVTAVSGYVERPKEWRELHPLGARHYWR